MFTASPTVSLVSAELIYQETSSCFFVFFSLNKHQTASLQQGPISFPSFEITNEKLIYVKLLGLTIVLLQKFD